jgi:hypothetical protein
MFLRNVGIHGIPPQDRKVSHLRNIAAVKTSETAALLIRTDADETPDSSLPITLLLEWQSQHHQSFGG